MEQYLNRGGDSGVVRFDIDNASITVQFRDNSLYLYNSIRPGQAAVNHMIELAK